MRSALFVLLIACGGGTKTQPTQPTPPPPSEDKPAMVAQPSAAPSCTEADIPCAIDTIDHFSKRMCGCADKACAEGVNTDMTKWGEEMSKKAPPKTQQPTDEQQKRLMGAVQAYTECMTKLMMGSAPPIPDPCGGGDPCGN